MTNLQTNSPFLQIYKHLHKSIKLSLSASGADAFLKIDSGCLSVEGGGINQARGYECLMQGDAGQAG